MNDDGRRVNRGVQTGAGRRTAVYRRDLRDTSCDEYLASAAVADQAVQVAPESDGDRVAYVKMREGQPDLWLWDGTEDRRLTTSGVYALRYGRTDPRWIEWHPEGQNIAYISAGQTVKTVDPDTGETTRVTDDDSAAEGLAYGPEGDRIAVVTDRFSRGSLAVAAADGSGTVALADDELLYSDPEWGADGLYAVRSAHRHLFDYEAGLVRVTVDGFEGSVESVYEPDGVRVASPRPSPTDEAVAFVHDASGYDAVALLESDEVRTLAAADEAELADPAWHPDGTELAGTVTRDAATQPVRIDRESGTTETLDEPAVHTGPRYDGERLLVVRDTPHEPPSVFDVTSDERVTPATTAGTFDAVPTPETISYESAGREIQAVVYPPDGDDQPILVHPHGGPTALDKRGFDFRAGYFARLGYCVVMPNYRGSDGYGRAFRMANDGDWGGGDLGDVIAAADAADEAYPGADGERVGIFGGSGGGLMTINALGNSDRFRAGAAFYGVYDYETFVDDTDDVGWQLMKRELGDLATDVDNYRAASPIRHVESIDEPTLILHGEEDARVPISQSEQLVEAFERHGGRYEFRRYDGEPHGFGSQTAVVDAYTRVADLFAKYLRIDPDDGSSQPHDPDEPADSSS